MVSRPVFIVPAVVAAITWKWCHDLAAEDARHLKRRQDPNGLTFRGTR